MSYMGMLFSPENPYYCINGSEKICRNGEDPEAVEYCKAGNPVWYGAWGSQDGGKVHAKLSFNPQFEQMMDEISIIFRL